MHGFATNEEWEEYIDLLLYDGMYERHELDAIEAKMREKGLEMDEKKRSEHKGWKKHRHGMFPLRSESLGPTSDQGKAAAR